jgi:hypothetical protein
MGLRSTIAILAVLTACGDNLEPEPDTDSTFIVSLETSAPEQIAAGDTLAVDCALTENDVTTIVPADVRVVNETSVVREGGAIIAAKVGSISVSCAMPDRGLVDPTPVLVEIIAGPAANVVTTITPDPVVAGNSVTATCEVYDAYGNPVTGESPTLQLSPLDASNTITDLTAEMIRAGHYTGRCQLPGTTASLAGFDVMPNLPASIVLAKFPDLPLYAVGNVVVVTPLVSDRYGNEIVPVAVTQTYTAITGSGPLNDLGEGNWKLNAEGRYRFDVSVDPPTDMDLPLTASTEVLVNSRGPAIVCAGDATMVDLAPGSTMNVTGTVQDVNGVDSLTINGSSVTVAGDGSFSAPIATRFGMNFVDVSATDSFGEPTTKVCTFLISDRYASPATPIKDTVSLKLTQNAIDDDSRAGSINSLDDLLYTIINSTGMSNTIHSQMLAANPIKKLGCDYSVNLGWPIGVVCVYSSGVEYKNRSFPGPNTVSLTLVNGGVNGGVRAQVHIPNVGVNLRVWGKVSGISYDSTGWVRISYIDIGVTLDTSLVNNQPSMSVRSGSVTTDVGTVTTDFNGFDGWIIDHVVVPLAKGKIHDAIRDLLEDFVTNNFNSALDGLLGGLDISTLGTTFDVQRIDGSGSVAMSFGLSFTTVSTNTSRMLFGIGTKFSTIPANAYASLGVPQPPGVNLLDPSVLSPANTGVGAHVSVINSALHALWRANYFDADLTGTVLGSSVPAGLSLTVHTRLPPVAVISQTDVVQLHLGALDLVVQHPDLPANLAVTLGADAHADVSLDGNDLVFGGVQVDELHVGTDDVNLTPTQQQTLEDTLLVLLQKVVDESLNGAIPALPIPAFTIPQSLSTYGLPSGKQLGINSPGLSIAPQHFTLKGQFGIRP